VPTIKDVARQAGVSIATVSRAYNGSPRVSEPTARRVLEVAERLDYWPNSAARSLSTRRTHVIGVLLPDLYGEFFSEVIRGVDHAARREGYQILVSCSHADRGELIASVRSMRGRVDGLIAMAPNRESASAVREIAEYAPFVLLNTPVEIGGCKTISIANFEGAYAMVRHLLALGHRRIATVCGPSGNIDAHERLRGYRLALRSGRIDPREELEFSGDFTEASGYAAAERLLELRRRPTAVFAANDYMAIGLISALRVAGVRVPEDVAVGGFDDIAMARFVSPPLTTVHVDAYALGQRAVQHCLASAGNRNSRKHSNLRTVLSTALVLRQSCGSSSLASRNEHRLPDLESRPADRIGRAATEAAPPRRRKKRSMQRHSGGGRT
jgi:LacI family transcriptional regulator